MKKIVSFSFILYLIFITLLSNSFNIIFGQEIWLSTTLVDAPSPRRIQTAIWTGTKMIVWGGAGYAGYSDTGGIYDISSNTWTATSVSNAPTGRIEHAAIWTGSKMIVWGGYTVSFPFVENTGGVFDPESNIWTSTSLVNAPSPRETPSVVWTGSKMIIWGGHELPSGIDLNTGGIYDPVTDSWTTISTTNAPSVRSYHTAVWTGNKMIVWGGNNAGNFFNTGGIYDPLTDSWITTSTTNAPSARTIHRAVWTGSKMIVWGGCNESSYLNTGGIYDPVVDSWIPTSTTNAPTSRTYFTAAWTGTDMIVWGGSNLMSYLNTGGIYNPDSNTWTPTSQTNAPTGRYRHTAIWTGSKMIVWGGSNDSIGIIYNNSGGSYYCSFITPTPPSPPVLTSPSNNSTGLLLTDTLRWNLSTGAVSYRLQVATDSNFTAFILNDSTITATSRIISGLSPLTWYYWRVNAKNSGGISNYSSVWKFKTIGPASGVALYTPVNNAVNQPITNLLFTWSHAVEQTLHLTILNYWFALYSDTTQSAIIIDSTLTDTLKTVSGLLNNTNYWWKVRAKSQLGYGPFSSYFHFTTIVTAPGPPTLYSPHDHSIVYTPNPLLDWLPVSAATGYRLQLTLDSTFTTIILDTTVSVDSFMVSGLTENKYYWHVNAQNAGGSSQYSVAWSFTVNLNNIVRNNNVIPKVFKLYNNYPNPFNPVSKIKFDIPEANDVKIIIYNSIGQNIATLVDSHLVPGSYSVEWNATIYPSGVYFYKITAGDFIQSKKMVLIK